MLLLILCPGTILAPGPVITCPESCQRASSPPALSGSATAAPCRRSSRCMTAPTPSSAAAAAPSCCGIQRGKCRRQPPEGVFCRGRRARQSALPRLTVGQAPRRIRCGQACVVCTALSLYAFNNGATIKRSWNHFPTQRGGFARPGPAAPSPPPQQRNPPCQRTPPRNPPHQRTPPRCPQCKRTPPQRIDL
jgi:hypothetical protein